MTRRLAVALAAAVTLLPAAPARTAPAWETFAPMASARTEAAYATLGNDVYVVGGFVVGLTNSTSVEVYDTARDTWREGPPMPLAVNHGMATAAGGEVYHAGGYLAVVYGATNAFFVLRNGSWTPLPPMPETRAAGGMVAVGDRIYVVGGFTQQGELARTTLVYNRTAGTWATAEGLPTPREHLTVVPDGRYLYAVGGREGPPSTNKSTVERYDTLSRTWGRMQGLLTARSGHVSAITSNGFLVSAGGEYQGGVFDSVEALHLRTGRRLRLPALEPGRTGFATAAKGTTFYVFSGATAAGYLDRTEALNLRGLR